MRLRGIRLVEQIEQKFRRVRVCLRKKTEKTNDCNSRHLLIIKAPAKNRELCTKLVFHLCA